MCILAVLFQIVAIPKPAQRQTLLYQIGNQCNIRNALDKRKGSADEQGGMDKVDFVSMEGLEFGCNAYRS